VTGEPWSPAALADGDLPPRVTAAGCVVRGGSVLLERRPDDAAVSPGVWDLPGGHVEPGERPEQTLVRELREELGIAVRAFRLGLVQDERSARVPGLYRHYVYLVDAWDGAVSAVDGQQLRWIPLAQLATLAPLNPPIAFALDLFRRSGWLAGGT
jgi:8-oxo-dGTP diphosphatase